MMEYARKENPIKAAPYSPDTNEDRYKFPGSNWLYLKLYLGDEKINEFLMDIFTILLKVFVKKGKLKKWFIVRYHDPESHLRLRIHSESFEMISKILSCF